MVRACKCEGKYPLLLFYFSLVLLFLDRPCIETIERAIDTCDEPVSEYFFIYALALRQAGKLTEAIDSINKSIEIDPGILEFYR